MDPVKAQLVQQSLGRCLLNRVEGVGFLDAFYDEFLASDPRIKPLFAKTDMAKQRGLLRHGLAMLIMYASGTGLAKSVIEQLALSHDRNHLKIDPGMYRLWEDSLLACVKRYDRNFDDALGRHWAEALEPGIAAMKQAY